MTEFEAYMQARMDRVIESGAARILGPALADGGWTYLQALWMRQYWFDKVSLLDTGERGCSPSKAS